MKYKLYLAALFSIAACSKGSVNPGNNNGGGGGNGNGGGGGSSSSSLTVAGFSPQRPYLDDTLAITGTGFNSDKSKDTVLFNYALGTIVSATSTELKVKIPSESNINMAALNYSSNLEVRANGKRFPVTGGIGFKRALQLNGIDNPSGPFPVSIGRPGDSLVINGSGFNVNGTGMLISIAGTTLHNFNIDSNYHCKAMLRLPKDFFGHSNDETVMEQKTITIINADGRKDSKLLNFYISPIMKVSDVHFGQSSYPAGSPVTLIVRGKNLKDDAQVELTGPAGSNYQVVTSLPSSLFADEVTIPMGSFSIKGNWHVNIYRLNALYGGADVRIN